MTRSLGRRIALFATGARPYANVLSLLGVALLLGGTLLLLFASTLAPSPAARHTSTAQQPTPMTLTTLTSALHTHTIESAVLDEAAHSIQVTFSPPTTFATGVIAVPDVYLHDAVTAFLKANVPLSVVDAVNASTQNGPPTGMGASMFPMSTSRGTGQQAGGATGVRILAFLLVLGGLPTLLAGLRRGWQKAHPKPEPDLTDSSQPSGSTASARRRSGGAAHGSAHLTVEVERPETRFADVAGCAEAVFDLTELVLFLTEPERFTRLGATQPKGALLCGPPGTGKTLLARAVAGEAGVPFYAVAGSDFVEKFVGVGPQRVRALFEAARKQEKAIIFIDEVDAIGVRRGGGDNRDPETEKTLLALLKEMDGFDKSSSVIVIAATNRPDVLDAALVRPGRLDRRVEVPNPDARGRREILQVHTAGKPMAPGIDLAALALRTPGFSGAQLAALVNEACMDAVRRDEENVGQDALDCAVATIAMGRARTSALVTPHDARVTAWHEAGHTLAAYLQPEADDPVQVTIIPRGPAGGVTWMSGSDDIFLTRLKAHAQLVTALAGRAGEEALLDGEFTQGAAGDLQSATELATRMATQYGMTRLGYQVRDGRSGGDSIAEVVEELLAEAYVSATHLLSTHRALLESVAARLLVHKTLTLADIDALAVTHGERPHATLARPALPARTLRVPAVPVKELVTLPVGRRQRDAARRHRPELVSAIALLTRRSRRAAQQQVPEATA